jgi:hypothetical protein
MKNQELSNLYKQKWEEIHLSVELHGSQPYKGSPAAFREYLARRQAEDAARRPGGLKGVPGKS